ncbi:APEH isoform 4, partial [Pan troglodytes]
QRVVFDSAQRSRQDLFAVDTQVGAGSCSQLTRTSWWHSFPHPAYLQP